jgi:ABC-type iron transport system FetAB ATPase subunit
MLFAVATRFLFHKKKPPTEPTSGLDGKLSKAVEDTLMEEIRDHTNMLKAIIWITHSEEQAERVGTRFMQLTSKGIEELHRSEP